MSMNSKNLSVLAYSNGFTLWNYKTDDAKTSVVSDGYFDTVANIFNVGDVIIVSLNTAGTPSTLLMMVSAVNAGSVSVEDIIPVASGS